MSATGVDVFDRTLQTTHIWLNEIGEHPSLAPDKQLSWHVLGAVLRAIRDNVPVELAAHFGAELPCLSEAPITISSVRKCSPGGCARAKLS